MSEPLAIRQCFVSGHRCVRWTGTEGHLSLAPRAWRQKGGQIQLADWAAPGVPSGCERLGPPMAASTSPTTHCTHLCGPLPQSLTSPLERLDGLAAGRRPTQGRTAGLRRAATTMAYNKDGPVVVIDNYDSFTYNLCQVDTLAPAGGVGCVSVTTLRLSSQLRTLTSVGRAVFVHSTSARWAASTSCTRTTRSRWRRFASAWPTSRAPGRVGGEPRSSMLM